MSKSPIYKGGHKFKFNDEEFADVQFNFEGKEPLWVHSNILRMECPKLFEKIGSLNGQMYQISMDIDANYSSFKDFLQFIYTEVCENHVENFNDLLKLVYIYPVENFEKYLSDHINTLQTDHILKVLSLCLENSYENFTVKVLENISEIFTFILSAESFVTRINKDVLSQILQLDIVDDSFDNEIQVFNAVMKHVKAQQNGIDDREYMSSFIKFIRFSTMTGSEFAEIVSKFPKVLTAEEQSDIFVEILIGKPNGFDFLNRRRLRKSDRKKIVAVNGDDIVISVSFAECIIVKTPIVNQNTSFFSNYPVTLKGIRLFNTTKNLSSILCTVYDQLGFVIALVSGDILPDSGSTTDFMFAQGATLNSDYKYIVCLDYTPIDGKPPVERWSYDFKPTARFSQTKKKIEFTFTEVNPLIAAFILEYDE